MATSAKPAKAGATPARSASPAGSPTSQRMQRRIIDAAFDVIAERGLTGATFATVASEAGVSQGVLVFHFKTKEELLAETLRRFILEYERSWRRAAATEDPLERIRALIRVDFSQAICSRKKLAFWFAFWGEATAKPIFNKICAAAEMARGEVMAEACRDYCERAGDGDPASLADYIDAQIDGLWLQLHINWKKLTRPGAQEIALAHLERILPDRAG